MKDVSWFFAGSHIAALSLEPGTVNLFRSCAKFLPAVTGSYETDEQSYLSQMQRRFCHARQPQRLLAKEPAGASRNLPMEVRRVRVAVPVSQPWLPRQAGRPFQRSRPKPKSPYIKRDPLVFRLPAFWLVVFRPPVFRLAAQAGAPTAAADGWAACAVSPARQGPAAASSTARRTRAAGRRARRTTG